MTPKQQERLRNKIKKLKAALAADKKHWGGFYDDSRGLRYLPGSYYIQLGDYSGGLRYFNWFNKNFPDDAGYPDFLFEWTVILFKTRRIKEAERKAFQAFTRNTYMFDKFFNRTINPIEKWEGSNLEVPGFVMNYFQYSCSQQSLLDFAEWLDKLIKTEKFMNLSSRYIDIQKKLNSEDDYETRGLLFQQAHSLEKEFLNPV